MKISARECKAGTVQTMCKAGTVQTIASLQSKLSGLNGTYILSHLYLAISLVIGFVNQLTIQAGAIGGSMESSGVTYQ